jgi:hypothetical protein
MPRVGWVLGVPLLACTVCCTDNPYVIGRLRMDAGVDASVVPDATVDPCSDGSALWCSGFESSSLRDEWSDIQIQQEGTVERTTARAHSGAGALRAVTRGPDSEAIVVAEFSPLRSGSVFFRAYVYVAAGLATETMNIFFIGSEPESTPFVGLDFNLVDGAVQVFSPQSRPPRSTGTVLIGRDRWVCFRAQVVLADQTGSVIVYLDDQRALEVNDIDTLPPDGIHRFRAGVDWSSDQTSTFEIFLDDIQVATSAVGCD